MRVGGASYGRVAKSTTPTPLRLIAVSEITGLARSTINRGEDDLDEGPLPEGRVRRKGGGGKPLCERDPTLVPDLQRHAEPATMAPMRPLKWVSKSPAKLAAALVEDAATG